MLTGVDVLLFQRLEAHYLEIVQRTTTVENTTNLLLEKQLKLFETLDSSEKKLGNIELVTQNSLDIVRAQYDAVDSLRKKLAVVRKSKDYEDTFSSSSPLITVRIATYNKTAELINTAIKSVLNQTYQNFEIIVVGDGCGDEVGARIEELKDARIRYVNFRNRSLYPEVDHYRWMVAGSPGMNEGANLAKGTWIAPLDDDDEFSPDHLEKLLAVALSSRSELVYGALDQYNQVTGKTVRIWSNPPKISQFSFQGAIYMKCLSFFEYDQQSWVMREPGDWNLCRRMQLAGVIMTGTNHIVGRMNMTPYDQKSKKKDNS
jgi:hypothetical protein